MLESSFIDLPVNNPEFFVFQILQGNDNSYEVVKYDMPYIATAQYVRLWPVSFCVHPCLRIEIYGEPITVEGWCHKNE